MNDGVVERRPTRLILYVGKGGVGKTTVAAATAARAAELGHRTLVVSTDLAHSLGDALAIELGSEPREIAPNLFAQEINVLDEARRSWGKVQDQLADLLAREGIPEVQADELAIIPGMEEVSALVEIGRKSRTGEFDCMIVDAAPTGETIRLLTMPESFLWYAGRIEEWRGRLNRLVGPFFRGLLPNLNVVDVVARLSTRIRGLREILIDPTRSSYRVVVTPESVVVKEARRAETYLNLFQYPVDAVVVNRVLPADDARGHPFLVSLLARQEAALESIEHAFATLPRFVAPWTREEPVGLPALSALARQLFGERDPTDVMHVGPTHEIERSGDAYVLRIPLRNVETGRLALTKRGDELYVDVGTVRRDITLPSVLAGLEPGTARVRQGVLEIPFESPDGTAVVERAAPAGPKA